MNKKKFIFILMLFIVFTSCTKKETLENNNITTKESEEEKLDNSYYFFQNIIYMLESCNENSSFNNYKIIFPSLSDANINNCNDLFESIYNNGQGLVIDKDVLKNEIGDDIDSIDINKEYRIICDTKDYKCSVLIDD